jgi:hypothetical protein
MALEPDDLGTRELLWLRGMVLFRCAVTFGAPLFAALLFHSIWAKLLCYGVAIILWYLSVGTWGMTVIAAGLALLASYIYLELESPPRWAAYIAGAVIAFQFMWIRHHLRELSELRKTVPRDKST